LLAALVLVASLVISLTDLPGLLRTVRSLEGPVPALLLVPLQIAMSLSFAPVPSDVVAFTLSLIYGFWPGTFLAWLAWMMAAFIEYAVARRLARAAVAAPAIDKLPAWLRRLPVDHPAFLICGRWLPLGPHVVNAAAGAQGVSLGRYTWCAALGIAPVAVLIAALATGLLGAVAHD
jgi:uncharacterized membrane protein YdjX (TVP38/TMEM64 family)